MYYLHRFSVYVANYTFLTIRKIVRWMLYNKTVDAYCKNQTENISIPNGQHAELLLSSVTENIIIAKSPKILII